MDLFSVSLTLWFLSLLIFVLHSFSKAHCSALSSEFLQHASAYFIPKVLFFLRLSFTFVPLWLLSPKSWLTLYICQLYPFLNCHPGIQLLKLLHKLFWGFYLSASLQPFGSLSCLVQLCCWQPERHCFTEILKPCHFFVWTWLLFTNNNAKNSSYIIFFLKLYFACSMWLLFCKKHV